MTRTCGIRIGPRRFEVVFLEGSAKKPRIRAAFVGDIPADAEDPVGAAVTVLREALKGRKLKADSVALAIDSGLAAVRTLTLPFDDPSKIESVLKFEVESQLPQWDIDDVVVDFVPLGSSGVETHLLVTAVPKDDLWRPLQIAERVGLDPEDAELEAVAIVNAAHHAGALSAERAEMLVYVGEASTSIVVLDGGAVRDLRAVHIGGYIPPVGEELPPVEGADGEAAPQALALPPIPPERRLAEASARVRRELVRTLTGNMTSRPIEKIWVTGMELPGLVGDTIDGPTLERLALITPEVGATEGDPGVLEAAFGAALGRMGGALVRGHLRREELRRTGRFERLELPLAVFGLLLVTVILVQYIITSEKVRLRDRDLRTWNQASNNYAVLGNPAKGYPGHLRNPPQKIVDYCKLVQDDGDHLRTRFEQLREVEAMLDREILRLKKELGRDGAIQQPQSALLGAALILDVLADLGAERAGRFSIRQLLADYRQGTAGRADYVEVKISMTFFADGADASLAATRNFTEFVGEVGRRPWCAEEPLSPKTTTLDDGSGIYFDNFTIKIDTTKVKAATS